MEIRLDHGVLVYREGSGGTVEILDIVVDNEHRREGVGRMLVEELFARIGPKKRVWAITRAGNEVAQQFYEALRFDDVNPLRRFYCDQKGVDAVMYSRWSEGSV